MILFDLLILLICTLIGYFVGHPGWGLVVGCVLVVFLAYAQTSPY